MTEKNEEAVVITLSLTRKRAQFLFAALFLCIFTSDPGCEVLSVSTYYPIPYGVYKKIKVTTKAELGPDVSPGVASVTVGDIDSGNYGIYASGGDLTFGAFGAVGTEVQVGSNFSSFSKMCRLETPSALLQSQPISYNCEQYGMTMVRLANPDGSMPYTDIDADDALLPTPNVFTVRVVTVPTPTWSRICCKLGIIP